MESDTHGWPSPGADPGPDTAPHPDEPSALPTDVPRSTPEVTFAARVPPPEPERPFPAARRAIFFDVENTSRPQHIARMIDHLAIDRAGRRTELVAVGNWRVIGAETGRLLARHGAHLVHSAPSTGVRDWSDLRIAVSAGVWLAGARPGDGIDIVSNDRAFDAVGDVAATLGVAFRRLSYSALSGMPAVEPVEEVEPAAPAERRPRRGRRGRRRRRGDAAPSREPAAPGPAPHTAPHDELVGLVRELAARSTDGVVPMDTLANALKAHGFRRPPGSPRLITRLRRIKEVSVSPAGMITLVGDGEAGAESAPPAEPVGTPPEGAPRRRRRSRRGGRRHRRRAAGASGAPDAA